jgi:cell wall-associated NlpC family hydrolase
MSKLVEQARTYLGTPWRHLGRSRDGIDCAGVVICAYADLGIVIPDIERYGREPHRDGLMAGAIVGLGDPVWKGRNCPRAVLAIGDVVIMTSAAFGAKEPHHIGIVGDDPHHGLSLIHADGTFGVSRVDEAGLMDQYLNRIVAVFRRAV